MAYILSNHLDGVLFFFHKCGHTNVREAKTHQTIIDSYYYTGVGKTQPAYKNYEELFPLRVGKEPQYILVRNPMARFYSGFYHYYRQWHENYDGLQTWITNTVGKIDDYDLKTHVYLHKIVSKQMRQEDVPDHEKTVTFYLHCVHNMLDDYLPGMTVIKLEDQDANTQWASHPLANAMRGKHENEKHSYNVEYPQEILQGADKEYIHNTYAKACNKFGYRYDY